MKRNILLIGGSTGIGLEIAHQLVKENKVVVASRNKGELSDDVEHLEFDVLKDNIEDLDLPAEIHGLVYCPGSINLKPFKMLKHKDFEEEMNLNFLSSVKVVQALMPKLKSAENASLVFFSTVAVKVGMPFHTSVAAAKGAIEGFAKALAAEYAPKMRVNVIAPSLTDTPLAEKLLSNDSKKEKMSERHPLKRIGNAKDIANAATFLLSEENNWITGQIISVDGGLSTLNIS
ncbi:SDR family oxidoreductase [Salegentibacter sp. JZCK2]|uniref:SDR family NAD(P)-dependent oxidoreductase n=1 Tax=Salegentibacter tibetensis TaxID=2873600 RepID=UPI001CCBF92E|nr:SDR family oxidoreductase [Salegentibacter tibetensis]MBZ9730935.1 SDR family oxidoreductase [Salegentibacter tibetensis]